MKEVNAENVREMIQRLEGQSVVVGLTMKEEFHLACHRKLLELMPQPTTPQIDNGDWIEWKGGAGKPTGVVVDVRYRDGIADVGWAYIFNWEHRKTADDIIAYRVIENVGREG